MKTIKLGLLLVFGLVFMNCTHDDTPLTTTIIEGEIGVGKSADTLLVAKFETAPEFDGVVDDLWKDARPLVNKATVTSAGNRIIPLNGSSGGNPSLEPTDLFDPFTGESYNYSLRGGHDGEYLYLLFEWEDNIDSQDRQSWYFDPITKTWHQENKYANHKNDKFYEDKFAMMFPIKDASGNYPDGFQGSTCTITCHANLTDPQPGHKTTRHYMANQGELADLWHWKRDRNVLSQSVDDGYVTTDENAGIAIANGRKGDEGTKMYDDKPFFKDVDGNSIAPKYVIKDREDYYWITDAEIADGTAQEVTAVDANGVLTLDDGSTIDPNLELAAYSKGFGTKRFPSITINPGGAGNDFRSDTQVRAQHVGTGWQIEIRRKLDSGDPTDAKFIIGEEIPFGLAIFNNAAIAHGQSNFLTMRIEN